MTDSGANAIRINESTGPRSVHELRLATVRTDPSTFCIGPNMPRSYIIRGGAIVSDTQDEPARREPR
ncbi:MAG: hypothetical protein AAF493_11400 [Pseudomonadota bacterium]